MAEAPRHPHNAARGTFVEVDGVTQPAPAPRFSRTPAAAPQAVAAAASATDAAAILADWGLGPTAIEALREGQVI